jgi:surface protein
MSANWSDYFEYEDTYVDGKPIKYYAYKDKNVVKLPANLPMPPTDTFYRMFSYCYRLQDITALANWNVSKVKNMSQMFYCCQQLQYITALTNWNVSNVKDMSDMFYGCPSLPHGLQCNPSFYMNTYISNHRCDIHQQISALQQDNKALQKENTELKTRLAYLEEKMDFILLQLNETVKWNP